MQLFGPLLFFFSRLVLLIRIVVGIVDALLILFQFFVDTDVIRIEIILHLRDDRLLSRVFALDVPLQFEEVFSK